jgi:hypothetical protein
VLPKKEDPSESENIKVKERISALATSLVTTISLKRTIPTLSRFGLIPPERTFNSFSLIITPHEEKCKKDAFYIRTGAGGQGVLRFCSDAFSTVRLFDVGAHETGHGLFDVLNPEYYTTFTSPLLSPEASLHHPYRAVHETFGDWAATYTSCEIAITQGKEEQIGAYLNESEFCIAAEWDGPGTCLRSSRSYSSTKGCEAHNRSILLTQLLVESMRGTYRDVVATPSFYTSPLLRTPKMALQYFHRLFISTVAKPPSFRSLREFGKVLQYTQDDMSRTDIACVDDFTKRSLVVRDDVRDLFYEIAQDNLNTLLESELGEHTEGCGS